MAWNPTFEDYLLVCILLDKLPSELRLNLARQIGTPEWDLNTLRETLFKEMTILADYSDVHHMPRKPKSTIFMFAGASEAKGENPHSFGHAELKWFPYCESTTHWPNICTVVKTVSNRCKIVAEKRLYFNCVSPKHSSSSCPSKKRCCECQRNPNTSLP